MAEDSDGSQVPGGTGDPSQLPPPSPAPLTPPDPYVSPAPPASSYPPPGPQPPSSYPQPGQPYDPYVTAPLAVAGVPNARRHTGRWVAVTAAVVAVVGVVIAGVIVANRGNNDATTQVAAPSSSPSEAPTASDTATPSDTPTPTQTPTPTPTVKPAKVVTHKVYIANVKAGHCFNEPKKNSSFVPELTTCAAPHDEQMMGTVNLGGGGYPGSAAVRRKADAACAKLFATWVGIPEDDSELSPETWWPSAGFWAHQAHTAQCAVHSDDEKTVGTLRGANR